MTFVKKHIKNIIIILLLLLSLGFFVQTLSLKQEALWQKSVPSVELTNSLSIGNNSIVSGDVVGFVKFNDKRDQPRTMEQYIKITALDEFDSEANQLFLYQDIIKMNLLAPRFFDPVYLKTISKDGDRITLSDEDGNLFFINKITAQVGMFDATSDKTTLVTDMFDFRDFVFDFYSK